MDADIVNSVTIVAECGSPALPHNHLPMRIKAKEAPAELIIEDTDRQGAFSKRECLLRIYRRTEW